ncbi:unnamed protein product [Brassica napus]|uniref:(rape) hypothetical protein n=1 Tax=Brassica napus TaxID=3708 RepID=A0A816XS23_BRANA|nr:unnamed protein product [Brassica napus]
MRAEFPLTDSSLMIRFNESTSFQELTEPDSPLPDEAFRFRNHSELIGLANTNTQLPDIIGEILSVRSTVCDPPEEKNRVMVTLKLDSDETVTLSFFDAQAVAFHKQLETMRVDPKVMVITSINPKIVGVLTTLLIHVVALFLNATSGTHVYFDKKTRAGDALFYKLVARDTGLPSAAPLLRSYAKVETMTIADLSSFIVSAESQEIDFLCTGRLFVLTRKRGGVMLLAPNAVRSCSGLSLHSRVEEMAMMMMTTRTSRHHLLLMIKVEPVRRVRRLTLGRRMW